MCVNIGFRIELGDTNIFKDAFESISKIVDEIKIEIDSEGFRVNALDRSHIAFVSLNLEATVFDEFECDGIETINIDTHDFMKILKRSKKNDVLTLEGDDTLNLKITFTGDSTRTFTLRLIDIEYDSPKPPELKPPCCVNISSNLLKEALTDMELFSESLSYTVDEDYFTVETDGEFGESNFKYLHGENITEKCKSSFSIDKLKDIFSASKFSDNVEVLLGNDMPVLFRFLLDTGDGELKFLLAPRLEADDE